MTFNTHLKEVQDSNTFMKQVCFVLSILHKVVVVNEGR